MIVFWQALLAVALFAVVAWSLITSMGGVDALRAAAGGERGAGALRRKARSGRDR